MSVDLNKIKECILGCDYKKLLDVQNIKQTLLSFDYKKIKYELNVSTTEQKVRYGLGALLFLISLIKGKILLLLLSVALIATAYIKWCPAYSGFGKTPCGEAEAANAEDETKEAGK